MMSKQQSQLRFAPVFLKHLESKVAQLPSKMSSITEAHIAHHTKREHLSISQVLAKTDDHDNAGPAVDDSNSGNVILLAQLINHLNINLSRYFRAEIETLSAFFVHKFIKIYIQYTLCNPDQNRCHFQRNETNFIGLSTPFFSPKPKDTSIVSNFTPKASLIRPHKNLRHKKFQNRLSTTLTEDP